MTNKWEGGSLLSHKAPTCVLFDGEGKFDSFGYEAEERYMELATDEDEDVNEWFYFQRFKMKLHGQKVQRYLYKKKILNRRPPPPPHTHTHHLPTVNFFSTQKLVI